MGFKSISVEVGCFICGFNCTIRCFETLAKSFLRCDLGCLRTCCMFFYTRMEIKDRMKRGPKRNFDLSWSRSTKALLAYFADNWREQVHQRLACTFRLLIRNLPRSKRLHQLAYLEYGCINASSFEYELFLASCINLCVKHVRQLKTVLFLGDMWKISYSFFFIV